MKVQLTSTHHFAAAHRLHNERRDPEWNRRVFDKCNHDHGHGHTYGLEVTVEGDIDPETGYVMDFKELKRIVDERVVRNLERRHLNFDVDFLRGINPTAENIAVAIWTRLSGALPGTELKRITLHETGKNSVVYEG
ncbi:MAG TPA: 6-carboxytetrahydropterin synthase [Thermoanaerobaculia bacterium]|nr:6-carboxytetrahydropterin synthase [Thermoanaerobaculia bacterium]